MDRRPSISAALVLALAAPLCNAVQAQGVTTYFESSGTTQKPRSNAGLSVGGDRLRMRADVALRGAGTASPTHALYRRSSGSTEVVPNVRSAFTIAKNLDIETRVNFAEWNAGADTTFDTRLRYRKSLNAFFDELDGSFWRLPGGLTKQVLRLGFEQILGDDGTTAPVAITGAALIEATQIAAADLPGRSGDTHTVGLETRVAGLLSPFLAADHTVSLKVEKTVGVRPESASTLAYDQSWTPRPLTELGFNLIFRRETYSAANDFAPSITFTWRSQF
jgi:hypothetical protein